MMGLLQYFQRLIFTYAKVCILFLSQAFCAYGQNCQPTTTPESILCSDAPDRWLTHYPGISHGEVSGIAVLQDSIVIVGNNGKIYMLYSSLNIPQIIVPTEADVISSDNIGTVYFSKNNQLHSFSIQDFPKDGFSKDSLIPIYVHPPNTSESRVEYPPNKKPFITKILPRRNGNDLWIGTKDHGLYKYGAYSDGTLNRWSSVYLDHYYSPYKNKIDSKQGRLPNNHVTELMYDRNDDLWIGTDNGLVCLKNDGAWEEPIPSFKKHCIKGLSYSNSRIWVLAKEEGGPPKLFSKKYEEDNFALVTPLDSSLRTAVLFTMDIDANNDLWIGADGFIARYPEIACDDKIPLKGCRKTPQIFSLKEGFPEQPAIIVKSDRRGRIWIGSGGRGLFAVEKKPTLRFNLYQLVRCHDDENGKFSVEAIEGTPPFYLKWICNNNASGEKKNFQRLAFENVKADTFLFIIKDANLNVDTVTWSMDNPAPIVADWDFRIKRPPFFPKSRDGLTRVDKNLQGGRVDSTAEDRGYKFIWSHNPEGVNDDGTSTLGIGKFSVTISDTMNCKVVLKDSFDRPVFPDEFSDERPTVLKGVVFAQGSNFLSSDAKMLLDTLSIYMSSYKEKCFHIIGHTSECIEVTGGNDQRKLSMKDKKKWALDKSRARALAVLNYLVQKGVSKTQLSFEGRGYEELLYNTPCDEKNQRVEIKLVKCSE